MTKPTTAAQIRAAAIDELVKMLDALDPDMGRFSGTLWEIVDAGEVAWGTDRFIVSKLEDMGLVFCGRPTDRGRAVVAAM